MRSLKVTCGRMFVPTPELLFGGLKSTTAGETRSVPGPVVKVLVTVPTIAVPRVSRTPAIEIVYAVFGASRPFGDNVTVWFPLLIERVTGTGVPPGASKA